MDIKEIVEKLQEVGDAFMAKEPDKKAYVIVLGEFDEEQDKVELSGGEDGEEKHKKILISSAMAKYLAQNYENFEDLLAAAIEITDNAIFNAKRAFDAKIEYPELVRFSMKVSELYKKEMEKND